MTDGSVSVDPKLSAGLFGRQKKDIIGKCSFYDRGPDGSEMLIFVDSKDTVVE